MLGNKENMKNLFTTIKNADIFVFLFKVLATYTLGYWSYRYIEVKYPDYLVWVGGGLLVATACMFIWILSAFNERRKAK